jgi:hypothetical protein
MRDLNNILCTVALSSDKDKPTWKWTKNGKFSVKSMYKHLSSNGIDRSFKHLWKAKIPLKIKVWLWLIWHNAIASKDNMIKRGWGETPSASFVIKKRPFCTCFSHVLQQNSSAVALPNKLGLQIILPPSLNSLMVP